MNYQDIANACIENAITIIRPTARSLPERFLIELWPGNADHARIRPEKEDSIRNPVLLLERAYSAYRIGQYAQATESFDQFSHCVSGQWSRHVSLFSRYAYFRVKLCDKLERWEELPGIKAQLDNELRDLNAVLPPRLELRISSQYQTGLAMSFLRSVQLQEAKESIDRVLQGQPDESWDVDLYVLYADRLTIRAVIQLNLVVFDQIEPVGALQRAMQDLQQAEEYFAAYGRQKRETHYVGRWFGAKAFIHMADQRLGSREYTVETKTLLDWAARAYTPIENRVPYGVMAGKYCEAYCYYFLASITESPEQKRTQLQEALQRVDTAIKEFEPIQDFWQPLAQTKFNGLGERIAWWLEQLDLSSRSVPDQNRYTQAVDRAIKVLVGRASTSQLIGRIRQRMDAWLATPIN